MSIFDLVQGDDEPVFTNRHVRIETDVRGKSFAYGGLALAHELVGRLELDRLINERVKVLRRHRPYLEGDHLLTHAYNLFVGGDAIEDIATLQNSEAFRNLVGAATVPDPSTAGDFLRRFKVEDLGCFQGAIDEARQKVWRKLPRSVRACLTIDMDSTLKTVYGECKEGADFTYKGTWGYHPLLISTHETKECLRIINRPGNSTSAAGAALALDECLGMAANSFKHLRLRGDSAFYEEAIILTAEAHEAEFAIVMDSCAAARKLAEALPERAWKLWDPAKPISSPKRKVAKRPRRKRERLRRQKALERNYRTLTTLRQWVSEIRYKPSFAKKSYRVVVKRQLIQETGGQLDLIQRYEYRFIITNNETDDAGAMVRFAYGRCDQENTIEQLKNGIAAMRMPTGGLLANGAFMLAAELAWNLRAWLSLVALPKETLSWEWKRFRLAFVYLSAKVGRTAGSVVARIATSHRHLPDIIAASKLLRNLAFA